MLLHQVKDIIPAYLHVNQLLEKGESFNAFEHAHKASLWDHILGDPERALVFNKAMENIDGIGGVAPVLDFDWAQNCEVVVDLAGGKGRYLANILQLTDTKKGILFDLPQVIAEAKEAWPQSYSPKTISKVSFVSGSFFNTSQIPQAPAGDRTTVHCYVLRNILHDWSDQDSLQILANLAASLRPIDKLIITETIPDELMQDKGQADVVTMMDIVMSTFQGKERTISQFNSLFQQSGFHPFQEVRPTRSLFKLGITSKRNKNSE